MKLLKVHGYVCSHTCTSHNNIENLNTGPCVLPFPSECPAQWFPDCSRGGGTDRNSMIPLLLVSFSNNWSTGIKEARSTLPRETTPVSEHPSALRWRSCRRLLWNIVPLLLLPTAYSSSGKGDPGMQDPFFSHWIICPITCSLNERQVAHFLLLPFIPLT